MRMGFVDVDEFIPSQLGNKAGESMKVGKAQIGRQTQEALEREQVDV